MRPKGFKHSEITKKRIGLANRRRVYKVCVLCASDYFVVPARQYKTKYCSEKCRMKVLARVKGSHLSEEHRNKISEANRGIKNGMFGKKGELSSAWKGGLSTLNELIRGSAESKNWRKSVFKRDNYTCQSCGERGKYLHADHIKPFAYFPKLRFKLSNGRTLCKECHKNTETYGNKVRKLYEFRSHPSPIS